MKNFSEDSFLGYVAAFLDGEGSIIFNKVRGNSYIRCLFTNTHEEVLISIQQRLGFGSIQKRKLRNGWKQCFVLCVSNFEDTERLLRLIRPYLIIKAEKADKALAIINQRTDVSRSYEERNKIILEEIKKGVPQVTIAARFGLSQQAISFVKLGHRWPSRKIDNGEKPSSPKIMSP